MDRLDVGIFVPSAPLVVAQAGGHFEAQDLEVVYDRVASSEAQFRDLASDRYQLVHTAFDNVASYRLNARNPLGDRFRVSVVFALDYGMDLTVIGAPEVKTLADLRGRTVSVDAVDTGFAYVLFDILASAGLERDVDYEVVRHGGVASRLDRLLAGDAAATLLSNGLELVAMARGLNRLARSHDVVSPYLGGVIAAADAWLHGHGELVSRFRAAYEEALRFVVDPANRADVVVQVASARGIAVERAEAVVGAELSDTGLARSTSVNHRAVESVLRLRSAWGGFEEEPDIAALVAPDSELFALER
ncbi:ABC transporter substrate-binding protein [Georgenia yuyongxinii]|uniref:ABC transporter substrate-binding protein n=1 Tax=Georgenia yuyongxinii TaxID=2589797 RepID=A0A552WT14_9MICO|nr:ABC transporter substrate-binding protein [Georgenia yuyongxinii]TRW45816.1 ABC transporter substrate-binding protein [Georgenia yuyongxinii]